MNWTPIIVGLAIGVAGGLIGLTLNRLEDYLRAIQASLERIEELLKH